VLVVTHATQWSTVDATPLRYVAYYEQPYDARPSGTVKIEMERLAVLAGVNSVAYPDPATVRLADKLGLHGSFVESCCTLAVIE